MRILNSWLNLLANLGVIVGLALVAYEINQTQRQLELSALADTTDNFTQAMEVLAQDVALARLLHQAESDFSTLDDFERWRVFKYLDGFVTMSEQDFLVMKAIGEVDLGGFNYDWEAFVHRSHFRAYWQAREERFGADFRAFINHLLHSGVT